MTAISSYWSSVGIRVDNKDLSKVDAYLAKIENKLKRGINNSKVLFTPKINVPAFNNQIRQALKAIGAGKDALRLNVKVNDAHLRNSLEKATISKPLDVRVSAKLDPSSLASIKEQLSRALAGIVVNARLGSVTSRQAASTTRKQPSPTTASDSLSHAQLNTIRRQIARGVVGDSKSAEYWASLAKLQTKTQQELLSLLQSSKKSPANSWNPNPWGGSGNNLARWTEFMAGRPEKSSLSAANRRMSDIMMQGMTNSNPSTLTGMLAETVLGGVGRVGSSSAIGRGMGALGSTFGRAGGAWGLIAGAVVNTTMGAVKGIWSGLGTMVSAPFRLISSASSAVTGAFYRIALAAAPLMMAFNGIDKQVREQTLQGVALGSMASKYGSDLQTERSWLMNMANRDGVEYASIVQPFTSFLSASAPAMGFERSKSIFEALTQYGLTHGANDYSMQNALKAFGQMSGKGTVQLEELKNQVGDAQGFGGMMPIFAEAWQQVLGRTGKSAKTGDVAIKELLEATQKGQVISAKILPLVEEIARRESATGLEVMRQSSNAGRARFMNTIKEGWINFTEGGGERAIKNFWGDMTGSLGQWFKENGAWLGARFELFVQDLKLLRIGITDTFKYLWTGENTSFVTWLAQEKGIDLSGVRVFFRELWAGTKEIATNILQTVGLLDKEGNFSINEFKQRIAKVTQHIGEAIKFAVESLKHLTEGLMYIGEILKGGVGGIGRALFDKKSPEAQFLDLATISFGKSVGAFAQGTAEGASAGFALVTPSDKSEGISDSDVTRNIHNIRNNKNLKNRSLIEGWAESLPPPVSSTVGVLQGIKNGVFSVLGIDPEKQKPFKALDNGQGVFPYNRSYTPRPPIGPISDEILPFIAGGVRVPTASSAAPTPSVAQGGQSFGLGAQQLDNMRGLFPYNKIYTTKPSIEDISIDVLPFIGGRPQAPTSSSILQPDVRQSSTGFSLDAQKMAPLDINVNVKMEVSGDPEQMKLYAAEEVAKGIADRVPKLLDESFDYKFSGKMKSVITDAPLN